MPFGNVVEYHILYILAKNYRSVMYRKENIEQIMFFTCFLWENICFRNISKTIKDIALKLSKSVKNRLFYLLAKFYTCGFHRSEEIPQNMCKDKKCWKSRKITFFLNE